MTNTAFKLKCMLFFAYMPTVISIFPSMRTSISFCTKYPLSLTSLIILTTPYCLIYLFGESFLPYATTMPVTRHVTYQGKVIPPDELPWQETVDGIRYSGTLKRTSYFYVKKNNTTLATYVGPLEY